ncbi:MAG: TraB/GumN family protein, partial [Asticcacaulis sp.]
VQNKDGGNQMFKTILIGLCLLIVTPALAQTKAHSGNSDPDWDIAEVTVAKTSAGPALWRVVKGDHVVWIIGYANIKRNTKWDSTRIDRIVAGAEKLYLPPTVVLSAYPRSLTALPEGQTLSDVLPSEDYERARGLIRTHGLDQSLILSQQPYWAANLLYDGVVSRAGLSTSVVINRLKAVASKHKVPVDFVIYRDLREQTPRPTEIPMDTQIHCFRRLLDATDIVLANREKEAAAWASGDVKTLRASLASKIPPPECQRSPLQTKGTYDDIVFDAIVESIRQTKRSVMILPIGYYLFDEDVLLNRLRENGYTVRVPAE